MIDDIEEMFDIIYEYARKHSSFNTDFVDDVKFYYEDRGELTDSQYYALENIIKKFRMLLERK